MSHRPTNRIPEQAAGWSDSATRAVQTGFESARDTISRSPSTAVFAAFGAGLGVGIGLALAFGARSPPPLDHGLREKLTQFFNEHVPWSRS